MKEIRIIPCLDIKAGRVVKGVNFTNLRDVRDPVSAAIAYCREGADEIVFLDIFASVENRKTGMEQVKKVCESVTVPLTVGGGITNLEDMRKLISLGADKISINTAAVRNPELIREASRELGKERIVVAIDGRKNPPSGRLPRLEVVINGGNESTGMSVIDWAKKIEELGASEILLTSKDADGTREGYDLEMTGAVSGAVNIPVIASGGAGTLEHLYLAVTIGKASAVLVASIFHFGEASISQAKAYLRERGIPIKK